MNNMTTPNSNISIQSPSVTPDSNLKRYLFEINQIPLLKQREEYDLAKAWIEKGDTTAAHRLVMSHLRLVAKIASGYRGYGLPYEDLISEGNIGVMHAVKRFNPDKGARLATYASWWIHAAIKEYILQNWSLVKLGTSHAQKKLFFKLKSTKEKIGALESGDLTPTQLQQISATLEVPENDVQIANRRLSGGDLSLNANRGGDGDSAGQWEDWLESKQPSQEAILEQHSEMEYRRTLMQQALKQLTPREIEIINERRLQDPPSTLDSLSKKFGVSIERIRQIENKAFEKLHKTMHDLIQAPAQLENKT